MSNPAKRHHRHTPNTERNPGPVFRVGLPDYTQEVVLGGHRYLYWHRSPGDFALATLAGWGGLPYEEHGDLGRISMPMDARSASSALAGAEAWLGEKDQILHAMSEYARGVYDQFRAVDTSLQLDTVAVTRGNGFIFMVPPHNLVSAAEPGAQEWLETLHNDIEVVLNGDPRNPEILAAFDQSMHFMREAQ